MRAMTPVVVTGIGSSGLPLARLLPFRAPGLPRSTPFNTPLRALRAPLLTPLRAGLGDLRCCRAGLGLSLRYH